ncbi:MAG: hypothetical protein ABSA78_03395 [Candidatus Sulfotelmatobacter sp.]
MARLLEHRAVKNPHRVLEVDVVLCEVGLAIALVPLEKHVYGLDTPWDKV